MTNYRDQVTNEVKEAAANSGGNDEQETLEQIEVDFGETPFVKFYPTVAITGTFPEDEGNPIIRFRDEDNNGHSHQGYLGLVMDDLRVDTEDNSDEGGFDMSGATIVETDDDDYTEYRAVNFNDEHTTEKFDGEAVNISGDQYGIDDTTTEIDGRAILVVDRTAAVSVAKKLDSDGATPADMDEETGQPNSGLIEYAPDDVDAEVDWSYARDPELRDELYGTETTVLVTRRSEVDEEYAEALADEDNDDVERDMMWYSVFNEDGEALEPVEGDAVRRAFLEWRFDPTAGHLPDDQWEFVQEYQAQGLPTDEENIVKNVEENFDDADTDRIVRLIQSGAGQ